MTDFGILFLGALVLLMACARPEPKPEAPTPSLPPVAAVPPAPTGTDTATPVPTPDVPFDESLQGDDLVKFRALPTEFQDALYEEATETANERAVQYLRELPDETLPLTELLDPSVVGFLPFNALQLFHQLDGARQRGLLLGGYADAVRHHDKRFRRYADELGEEHLGPKRHAVLFAQMVEPAFDDVRVRLPPIDEALSPEAMTKLDSLDPLMQRIFRESWGQSRPRMGEMEGLVESLVAGLERGLLAAPTELPSIEEIGLSAEYTALFKQLPPEMRQWLWGTVAGDLLRGTDPKDNYLFGEELQLLQRLSSATARDTFARGYLPAAPFGTTPALACAVQPPPGATPVLPEDLPDRPVFLPPPQEALSAEALARLEAMDPLMQQAFNDSWEGSGPVMPDRLACTIAMLEINVLATPFTSVPALEDFLPPELVELSNLLRTDLQETLESRLADQILTGRTRGMMYPGGSAAISSTPFEDADLDAFFDALRTWVEWQTWLYAGLMRGEATEPPTAPPSEPLADDATKYRTLPTEIVEALRRETERTNPPDFRPAMPGPANIKDILSASSQNLFDRLPVTLKEAFWRSVAREIVYGSSIQTVGGRIIGNARIVADAWVRLASQVTP